LELAAGWLYHAVCLSDDRGKPSGVEIEEHDDFAKITIWVKLPQKPAHPPTQQQEEEST